MKLEVLLTVLSLVFLVMAGFLIPVLMHILRAVKALNEVLQHLNQGLPLILRNLGEITTNVNRTTTAVNLRVAELSLTLQRVQGIVGAILGLEEAFRHRLGSPLSRTFRTSVALAHGIRVFLGCLTAGQRKDREPQVELPR